jgi:hypothetical protein
MPEAKSFERNNISFSETVNLKRELHMSINKKQKMPVTPESSLSKVRCEPAFDDDELSESLVIDYLIRELEGLLGDNEVELFQSHILICHNCRETCIRIKTVLSLIKESDEQPTSRELVRACGAAA